MMRPLHAPPDRVNGSSVEPTLRDHRPEPPGTLPRYANRWVLLGITSLVLFLLIIASRPSPPRASLPRVAELSPELDASAVALYRNRLDEQERQIAETRRALDSQTTPVGGEGDLADISGTSADDEHARLKYTSLFADSLAFSRRTDAEPPNEGREARLAKLVTDAMTRPGTASPRTNTTAVGGIDSDPDELEPAQAMRSTATATAEPRRPAAATGTSYRLPEGTVIEAALMHLVDGELGGQVRCLVNAPVYAPRRDVVLVPAGSVVVGTAQPVSHGNQRRLAVTFHRILRPDGTDIVLDRASAAGQRGDQGISSRVDQHYWSTFGAAGAVGLIAGLAQSSTRDSALDAGASDVYRQGVASSLSGSSLRILDRYLNRMPTIAVDQATPVTIVIMQDVQIPAYQPQHPSQP